ncbi:MAG: alkylation response protein AidB-like acyl-CoA dehydrogenase [Candidatus Poriferisodalaceae bacterium]|jgi:alkylation response protein AidB-like acyl-CoA dehydrogenase
MTPDERGRELAAMTALVHECGPATQKSRQPNREVVTALARAGLMRLVVPETLGGHGIDLVEFMAFGERLAIEHGSTAWVATTCNEEAGIAAAYLPAATIAAMYDREPDVVIAGSGIPRGRASRVDGGWSITGRWTFVSGCTAADKIVLANVVSKPREQRTADVELCFVLVNRDDVTIDDTWDTLGMRGTGSHDVVLDDMYVPDMWAGVVANKAFPLPDTPFYRLPSGLRFPWPKVGIAAGVARAALSEFHDLAGSKQPINMKGQLRDRPHAQTSAAQAEALISTGVAWARELATEVWAEATADRPVSPELHARSRLACSTSVQQSIRAIELLSSAAGSTANTSASPFGVLLADARAVAAHFMVAPYQVDTAGRVLLGLNAGDQSF